MSRARRGLSSTNRLASSCDLSEVARFAHPAHQPLVHLRPGRPRLRILHQICRFARILLQVVELGSAIRSVRIFPLQGADQSLKMLRTSLPLAEDRPFEVLVALDVGAQARSMDCAPRLHPE